MAEKAKPDAPPGKPDKPPPTTTPPPEPSTTHFTTFLSMGQY